jgi:hypothetical protein
MEGYFLVVSGLSEVSEWLSSYSGSMICSEEGGTIVRMTNALLTVEDDHCGVTTSSSSLLLLQQPGGGGSKNWWWVGVISVPTREKNLPV